MQSADFNVFALNVLYEITNARPSACESQATRGKVCYLSNLVEMRLRAGRQVLQNIVLMGTKKMRIEQRNENAAAC